jgi:hypothetical protein
MGGATQNFLPRRLKWSLRNLFYRFTFIKTLSSQDTKIQETKIAVGLLNINKNFFKKRKTS